MIGHRYLGVRSLLETPIMDDHKWAKIPGIPTDAVLVDLEDSVPPPLKEAARERVVEALAEPDYFEGRLLLARGNHLSTPWGRDDLQALGEAGVTCLAYPKCETVEDALEVRELLAAAGATPDLHLGIESALGVVNMTAIAQVEGVVGIGIGIGDLSADLGVPLYGPDGTVNETFAGPRAQVAVVARAFGLLSMDFPYAKDIRDLDEIRRQLEGSRRMGYTSASTFYPPHVEIINDVFSPSAADVEAADEVIGIYEASVAAGDPAALLPSGRTILVHDYQKAQEIRRRHEAVSAHRSRRSGP
jgi:citrate lyase beta subunit